MPGNVPVSRRAFIAGSGASAVGWFLPDKGTARAGHKPTHRSKPTTTTTGTYGDGTYGSGTYGMPIP